MNNSYFKALIATTFIFVLMLSFSCAKKQVRDNKQSLTSTSIGDMGEKGTEEPRLIDSDLTSPKAFKEISESETGLKAIFKDIHFDYDDFSIRPDAKEILNNIAEWMLQNTSSYVLVEGHCDDRGTNEYNLALGERRAKSAKKYLVQLGVSQKRISTISYGEEKPLDPAQNEAAWAKNRRDHFLIR